jgi:hypothetical protein
MLSALKNDWKEGQERHVSLPDHEPETLEGYINWLYTKGVTLKDAEKKCGHHGPSATQQFQDSECSHMHCLKLVKMYMLGDYLNDMQFCNAVMDRMENMQGCVPGPDAISLAWGHMLQDCPVQKFVLEKWGGVLGTAAPRSIDFMRQNSSEIPKGFLFDLLAYMEAQHCSKTAKHAEGKNPLADKCRFHKHVDDTDKCH